MQEILLKILFVLFVFFSFKLNAIADHSLSDGTYCDGTDWVPYKDEKCYKLIQNWATRDSANNSCAQEWLQTDSTVPQLVTIKSAEEQDFLTKWVFVEEEVMINVWIGAKRLTDSNDFVWDDGSAVEFTNWVDDGPSDEAKSACVVMQSKYVKSLPKENQPDVNGKWKNMFCGLPSYFVCEKLPRWSIFKLQQTLLGQRKELDETQNQLAVTQNALNNTQNDLSITKKDLIATKNELSVTKNDLTATKSELSVTKNDLTATKSEVSVTKNDLTVTKSELSVTKNDLAATKSQLTATKNDLSTTNANVANLKQNSIPIGFIYAQLPKEKSPVEIWPEMTWADVSASYAGFFFRVSGNESASFGQTQEENLPRITRVESKPNPRELYASDIVPGGWSDYVFTGHFKENFVAIRFQMSGGELRPRNMAIRVWKRTG